LNHDQFNWGLAILLGLLYIAFDFLYAIYYMFVAKKKALHAANTAVIMYLLSAFGTISFIHNPWYITSIAIGSFIGTYIAVKYFSDKIK
jgi:uncharacterized membrane protein YfcA